MLTSYSTKLVFYSSCIIICSSLVACTSKKCFAHIGCFSTRYPWFSPSRPFPLPESPAAVNVSLMFFSREQVEGEVVEVYPKIVFNGTGFEPNRRTVAITHGFASSATADWVKLMKDKYIEDVDANIFLVNWKDGADGLNYFQASSNTRVAGAILGRFGSYLITEKGVNVSDIHLIGHSLGSHVSAYAAKAMNNASTDGKKIYRITGLDPAQPGFQSLSPKVRLNERSADFVEAIHSDAKPFIPFFGFGYLTDLGDLDIYLNRGYNQPKCVDLSPIKNVSSISQLANVSVEIISKFISCSHGRSYEIFIASIDKAVKCKFVGHRLITRIPISSNQYSCGRRGKDCVTMGLDTPEQNKTGTFQVMTSGKSPYCCYNYSTLRGCSSSPNKTNSIFGR